MGYGFKLLFILWTGDNVHFFIHHPFVYLLA